MTNIVSERLQHNRETPKGIGGWLIILILGLTLVAPLWQLRIAVHTFETLLSPEPLTHAGVFRLSAVVAIYAGLGVFSFISGIMLWSGNRRAPAITKAYLIVSLLAVVILYSSDRAIG